MLVVHGALTTVTTVGILGFSDVPMVSETFCQLGIITIFVSLVNGAVTFPAAFCTLVEARSRLIHSHGCLV